MAELNNEIYKPEEVKPFSKAKVLITASVLVLGLAAVGVYYLWPRFFETTTPPTIEITSEDGGQFQGYLVEKEFNFLQTCNMLFFHSKKCHFLHR